VTYSMQVIFALIGNSEDVASVANLHREAPGNGAFHLQLCPVPDVIATSGTGSTLSATRASRLAIFYLTAFFDHYLRDAPLRLLTPGLTTVPSK
jgi:hypothetical protein